MKKLKYILALLVITGGAGIGAVWWSAQKAEQRFEERTASLTAWFAANAPEIKITAQSYERGLFRSSSTVTLTHDAPAISLYAHLLCDWTEKYVPPEFMQTFLPGVSSEECPRFLAQANAKGGTMPHIKATLLLHNQIQHGPWLGDAGFGIANVHTQVTLVSEDIPADVVNYINALQIDTVRSYTKDFDMRIAGPAISKQYANGNALDFQGGVLRLTSSKEREFVDVALDLPAFSLAFDGMNDRATVNFSGLKLTVNQKSLVNAGDWFTSGNSELALNQLNIASARMPAAVIKLHDMYLKSQARYDNELYGEQIQSNVAFAMYFPQKDNPFGGAQDLDVTGRFYTELSVKNLDLQPLANVLTYVMKNPQIAIQGRNGQFGSEYKAYMAYLEEQLIALISKGLETEQKLVATLDGVNVMSWDSAVKFYPVADNEKAMNGLLMLMSKLAVNATYEVNADVITHGIPQFNVPSVVPGQQMQSLLQQGIFVREGENYKMDMSFDRGTLTVNGQKRSLFDR